ncbi:unnamed protein product [Rotaria sp. Silwood2]|nr:unnamed protein product [Rotaria sp. Silwood2]CAF3043736.1 unnamed protein product [Rotaria sp. Silwood2]CAF3122488.1 unnamed protein product [Rotaria sp. Silwood2]CAF4469351.1 unnamed protein product [Rotaria sp. Silwood2]CAF4503436.1 unnamed protein product [Rotaria sp. Silwood2]
MVSKISGIITKTNGFYLITNEIGLMNFFIQHTSVSLLITENAVPDVRVDMETILNKLLPKDNSYKHLDEGKDYMQTHAKCSLLGSSINIPITSKLLVFGA